MAGSTLLLLGPVVGRVLYQCVGYMQTCLPAIGLMVVEMVLSLMIAQGGAVEGHDEKGPLGRCRDESGSEDFNCSASLEMELAAAQVLPRQVIPLINWPYSHARQLGDMTVSLLRRLLITACGIPIVSS